MTEEAKQPPLQLLIALMAISGVILYILFTIWGRLQTSYACERDLYQDYLLGRAVRSGVNPYAQTVSQLTTFLAPDCQTKEVIKSGAQVGVRVPFIFDHPTPHPPFLGLLFSSLERLGLTGYSRVYLLVQILTIGLGIILAGKLFYGRSSLMVCWLIGCAWLFWPPLIQDLLLGNFNTFLLVLTLGFWFSLTTERVIQASAMLALMLNLKLFGLPFLLFLLIRKNWRVLFWSSLFTGVIIIVQFSLLGLSGFLDFLRVFNQPSGRYICFVNNYSLLALSTKAFGQSSIVAGSVCLGTSKIHFLLGWLFLSTALCLTVYLAITSKSKAECFAHLTISSAIFVPVLWNQNLTLLLVPLMAILGRPSSSLRAFLWDNVPTFLLILLVVCTASSLEPQIDRSLGGLGGSDLLKASISTNFLAAIASLTPLLFSVMLRQQRSH